MVYVYLDHAFGPHRDFTPDEGSRTSIALRVSTWASHDCIPGDDESAYWMKYFPGNPITHEEGNIVGRFGDVECYFDKAGHEFSFGKNFLNARKLDPRIMLTHEIN